MNLTDAHIHLSDPEYSDHIDEIIADARESGVSALVSNSTDFETSRRTLWLAEKFPLLVYPALGIHPWNVSALKQNELEDTLDLINEQAQRKSVVAIGEIGLDLKYDTIWEQQIDVFEKMLRVAEKTKLPAIIHSRGTTERILEMLPSYNLEGVLLHWFSYPPSSLQRIVEQGYLITEGPPTVYSDGIREIVSRIPLTNLLTETDGPVKYYKRPFCGQLTKPSFVRNVVDAVADVKKMPSTDVAKQITCNFENFFNIKLN
jgi:TatD DNase family protein